MPCLCYCYCGVFQLHLMQHTWWLILSELSSLPQLLPFPCFLMYIVLTSISASVHASSPFHMITSCTPVPSTVSGPQKVFRRWLLTRQAHERERLAMMVEKKHPQCSTAGKGLDWQGGSQSSSPMLCVTLGIAPICLNSVQFHCIVGALAQMLNAHDPTDFQDLC